ncbi:oxidoreductase [Mucor ambiguus]|uniref:Oxidoreductase n=1 Tax=Mucor ambiguus TaxID=91626 RepID=A0A0C9LWG0_9FUNG|nr:oxidoreductase [Mucor ambiguus]
MTSTVPSLAANIEKPPGTPIDPADTERVKLFQPLQQKSVTLHNRLGVSPMCMYSSVDGHLNDFHVLHYGSLALKGPGIVFIEASAIVPEGRITPQDSGLWNDSHINDLKRVVDVIKSQGSTPGIQIAHAGRKASMSPPFKGDYLEAEADGGWPNGVVGPSDNAYAPHYAKPHALTVQEIKQLVQSFVDAAVRADKAGIEVLEIHAAHGYLLSSFFSGNSNKRTDEYGGSFENRIRFGLEVVKAVRDVWPDHKPLWVRISCAEYVNPEAMGSDPDGWDIYQSCKLAAEFKKLGVDMVDCSSGGNIQGVKYPSAPMYQVQFSEAIKREAGIQTAAVGLIVEGTDAEQILQKNQADYILAAREFLRDSAFVLVSAQALDVNIKFPNQYEWAVRKARRHNTTKPDESKHGSAVKMTSIP